VIAILLGLLPLSSARWTLIRLHDPRTTVGMVYSPHLLSEDRGAQVEFALQAAVGFALAAVLAATGIGLLRRQNWARVSALVLTLVCGIPVVLRVTWWAVLLLQPLQFAPVVQGGVPIVVLGGQAWAMILFILWLLSDGVIAACHGGAALPPALLPR
jgi:hypothetical protein